MPVTLSSIIQERACVTIPVMDDAVKIWYTPGRVTPAYAKEVRLRMATELDKGVDGEYELEVVKSFLDLVLDWDLLAEEGGSVVPLNEDELFRLVPIPFLNSCLEFIMGDITPGEAMSGSSAAGYRAKGNSAAAPTTTRSSGQRNTSNVRRGSFSRDR